MLQTNSSVKDRIGQALYVVGIIIAIPYFLLGILWLVIAVVNIFTGSDEVLMAVTYSLVSVGSLIGYGFVWGLRWIISGTTTTLFDYLRKK